MSNAIALPNELSGEQLNLVKSTVAKGATDDELKLFLYRCRHMGLDPLKPGQIHFIKYGNSPGTIVVGIEGFRSRAASTGKHAGTKRGVLRNDKGQCVGGWCEVYRADWKECAREEVSLSEYNTGKAQWAKMPETMIKKVAEAAALRMAFPDELGGVYSDDEMGQADAVPPRSPERDVPRIENPLKPITDPKEYVVTFGKFDKKKLKDCDMFELENYRRWVIESAKEKNKPIQGKVKEFIDHVEAYLASIEVQNSPPDDSIVDAIDEMDRGNK